MMIPELRPLGVGELIDVAIKIWRRHFPTLARTVIVVVAPVQLLATLIFISVTPEEFNTIDPTTGAPFDELAPAPEIGGGEVAAFLAGAFTATLLPLLGSLLAVTAVLRAVSVAYLGGTPDWRESLRLAAQRFGSILWLAVLMGVGLMIAFVMLFVPFVWLLVAWSMAFAVLVAEGQGGTGALRRSFALVRGRWWPTLGALLLGFLIQYLIDLLIELPVSLVFGELFAIDLTSTFALSALANIVSSVITTPFLATVFVLIYFDLRVRKEGFDLELLARAIGPEGLPGPGGARAPSPGWAPPPAAPPAGNWPPPATDWPPPPAEPPPTGWPPPSEPS